MTQKELKTSLIGKQLQWTVPTYRCNIEELDFGDVSIDGTVGLHMRHENGNYNFQRFSKDELQTLISNGEYMGYMLLDQPAASGGGTMTRPDLPHGTPVMCKPKRGEHWIYQLYRREGCTTDYEDCTSTNTGWLSICPLDKFKPTCRTWMPQPQDDYAR